MKTFEPLSQLDRLNLHELITDPRMETLRKLVERVDALYQVVQLAPAGKDETEFQYLRRIFKAEGMRDGINELLMYMENESYPDEKPQEEGPKDAE